MQALLQTIYHFCYRYAGSFRHDTGEWGQVAGSRQLLPSRQPKSCLTHVMKDNRLAQPFLPTYILRTPPHPTPLWGPPPAASILTRVLLLLHA